MRLTFLITTFPVSSYFKIADITSRVDGFNESRVVSLSPIATEGNYGKFLRIHHFANLFQKHTSKYDNGLSLWSRAQRLYILGK